MTQATWADLPAIIVAASKFSPSKQEMTDVLKALADAVYDDAENRPADGGLYTVSWHIECAAEAMADVYIMSDAERSENRAIERAERENDARKDEQ